MDQESALDLSPDSGGSTVRRDRGPSLRQDSPISYHQAINNFSRCLNVTSDPGPSRSQGALPRNESRQAGQDKRSRTRTLQEKIDAINRVHSGKSKAAVARDIGVPESTLRGWCKAEQKIRIQLNNIKVSGTPLAGYGYILTSNSDNSNNSRACSSSRSAPTARATILGSATSIMEKVEKFETDPPHKRLKIDNTSANISTSARAMTSSDINPFLYNIMSTAYINSTLAMLTTILKPETFLSFSGYAPAATLFTDSLLSGNNCTVTNTATTNMRQQQLQQQQQQQQQYQSQQQINATTNTLPNESKKKSSVQGYSTIDIQRAQCNRSSNVEKSSGSSISQPSNQIMENQMPSTSTNSSNAVVSVQSRNGKTLNSIIDSLHGSRKMGF
ncbi:PREDICTED: protein distal antenna-related-like [Cyphomyrmex costatus]|uniref:Protein distal antenna n=1 Tax=Cyphomyrmex costatus TaxID=456900 RepID=A0A195CSD7_9HYME|nr:PREDICTED: protein distal antenna-related-like [Cyphomyrmex costatus]KYN03621.1 Protein distal antenna [Cyphomyrmex costatus]